MHSWSLKYFTKLTTFSVLLKIFSRWTWQNHFLTLKLFHIRCWSPVYNQVGEKVPAKTSRRSHSSFARFCVRQHSLRNSEENTMQTSHQSSHLFVSVKRFQVLRPSLISLLAMYVEKSLPKEIFSQPNFCCFQGEKNKMRHQVWLWCCIYVEMDVS